MEAVREADTSCHGSTKSVSLAEENSWWDLLRGAVACVCVQAAQGLYSVKAIHCDKEACLCYGNFKDQAAAEVSSAAACRV